ncbi:hypothetical protein BDN70DRAFT_987984 [Pholiota conissans]|uniref:Uncharacterized protein n=1 Tax=Pholiota conissans TaxID=109636 RepID=A0A9P5ZFZ5_9AGAR|nr:hypothetical protein BDN70DRAFT_987984 [Pholiota conissans]
MRANLLSPDADFTCLPITPRFATWSALMSFPAILQLYIVGVDKNIYFVTL